jgi:methylphosphotriester-DNA--protein-cysteine methyltransferase
MNDVRSLVVALVVIDAADARCHSMASAIAALRRGFPSVPVLAYCSVTPGCSPSIVDVVRAGASGLILRGIDDARFAIRAAMRTAGRAEIARRIQAEVALHVPAHVQPLVRYAVTRAADEPSVEDAARSLGVDRKTIFNWMRDVGDVGPREFLNWIRLAIAVGMLEDPGRSAEHVALEAGFSSGTAFRNMLQRYTGLACSEIRSGGGLSRVLGGLFAALASETESAAFRPIPMPDAEMRASPQMLGA